MFTHPTPFEDGFTMHDCRMTGPCVEKDAPILTFENGVWSCVSSAINPEEKTIRTERAKVRLDGFDAEKMEFVYFRELRVLGWKAAELRKYLSLEGLECRVNSGGWEMEFTDAFTAEGEYLFRGLVWRK